MINSLDFKNPDYTPIYQRRSLAIKRIRAQQKLDAQTIPNLLRYYRDVPWQFIADWGMTYDPRNVERNVSALVPFIPFPRQVEWLKWAVDNWRKQQSCLTEKSRETGVTWLAISLSCTLCILYDGLSVGFGSRKGEYVDKIGEPKSIFEKGRMFLGRLPVEFRAGWTLKNHAPHMRLIFPDTGSSIGGEGGDAIGRGDRRSYYVVDEAAHLEHPELVDAALSMTTNCRIDISSVNGDANPFAIKRHSGAVPVFTLHWRDDPRKDDAWYARKVKELNNPIIVAQELDINYKASSEGGLIPSEWIQAAIGANDALVFPPEGAKFGALDVADEGADLNAFCGAHGVVVQEMQEWSGKGGDIFDTVLRAFGHCDEAEYTMLRYDGDGLGASVRGDARIINEQRKAQARRQINVEAFRGSAAVLDPESEDVKGRKNKDYFDNAKAQGWWDLRMRFMKTFRAVREGIVYPHSELISLRPGLPNLSRLCLELSQPTYHLNHVGKIVVDKAPNGMRSPNMADAVMIRFARLKREMIVPKAALDWSRQRRI